MNASRLILIAAALGVASAPALAQDPDVLDLPPDEMLYEEVPEPDAAQPDDPFAGVPADEALAPPPAEAAIAAEPAPDSSIRDEFSSVIRGDRAVLRGLDKVTARTRDFVVPFGEPLEFGSLTVLVRYCSRRPPELIPETFVFLEVYDRTFDGAEATEYGQEIFSGWMLGSSPALHGLEHPVYDIWPVACYAPGETPPSEDTGADEAAAAAARAAEDDANGDEIFVD